MIISSVPGVIEKKGAVAAFVISLLVTGLGTGGFKANISPLVAEQYKRTKLFVTTTKSGERVIVDPVLTTSRIYMVRAVIRVLSPADSRPRFIQYFYLFINIGALVGQISMTYAEKVHLQSKHIVRISFSNPPFLHTQYVGFYLAFTLPTVVFLLCPIILFIGRNRYTRSPPTGSVLASSIRLLRYAARGRWSLNPFRTIRNFNDPDFWERVKPSRLSIQSRPKWMTFDDQWVNEVKRGFKACAVFCWFPIYCACLSFSSQKSKRNSCLVSADGI